LNKRIKSGRGSLLHSTSWKQGNANLSLVGVQTQGKRQILWEFNFFGVVGLISFCCARRAPAGEQGEDFPIAVQVAMGITLLSVYTNAINRHLFEFYLR
jgi:hypothetical protein